MKISKKADESEIDWAQFKYMVFDVPNHNGTYEQRYADLGNTLVLQIPSVICSS